MTFTPTQQRFVDILSDGESHPVDSFFSLVDCQGSTRAELLNLIQQHVFQINVRLEAMGRRIVSVYRGQKTRYMLMQRLKID